jgi:hypothetical protein
VCAVPEILLWEISPQDKFAVIASDGVFEFLTSQTVISLFALFIAFHNALWWVGGGHDREVY